MHVFYLLAALVVLTQATKKRFVLEIRNITCPIFSNHLKHFECAYQKLTNGKYLFNVKFMADIDFGKDVDMHLRVRVTPWKGKTSFNFFNLRVNVCVLTSQVFNKPLLQTIFNEMIRTSNLPWDCPFKANVMYKVDNYTLTDEVIPVYAPFLNATYSLNFFQDNQPFGEYTVSLALIPNTDKKTKT